MDAFDFGGNGAGSQLTCLIPNHLRMAYVNYVYEYIQFEVLSRNPLLYFSMRNVDKNELEKLV